MMTDTITLPSGKILELFCADSTDVCRERGDVYCENKKIFNSFPYSYEIVGYSDDVKNMINNDKILCTKAIEGSLIRVFYFEDRWFITTHRKLDAYKSKWGNGKSFGEIFEDAITAVTQKEFKEFMMSLDYNIQYIFLTTAVETTRIVCEPPTEQSVYLYQALDSDSGNLCSDLESVSAEINIPLEEKILFANKGEVEKHLNTMTFPFTSQGLLFFNTETFESYKFIAPAYQKYSDVRGNMPSVMFAYLHHVNNEENKFMFKSMYPSHLGTIEKYEQALECVTEELFDKYYRRFSDGYRETYSKNVHYFIENCRKSNRNLLTREQFEIYVKNRKATELNKLIKGYIQEQEATQKVVEDLAKHLNI